MYKKPVAEVVDNYPDDNEVVSVGVGSKSGPSPNQVHKATLKYPIMPTKAPSIKFEMLNSSRPAIKFSGSDEAYPIRFLSSERKNLAEDFIKSKLLEKGKSYKYTSKIRYNGNSPYRSERVVYPKPKQISNEALENFEEYVSALDRDRIYRNDFPNDNPITKETKVKERLFRQDIPEENDVSERRIDPDFVPSHGSSKLSMKKYVLVKRNNSINYDQEVIPSSQISKLPYPTQIPKPPFSTKKLPYLPLAKYKTSVKTSSEVKSLPVVPPSPSTPVRNSPQYPHHNSYVLAKLKRSDIPR